MSLTVKPTLNSQYTQLDLAIDLHIFPHRLVSLTTHRNRPDMPLSISEQYDFIVIEGGTASLVVGTRRSEVLHLRVLVVEAGTDESDDPRVKMPALYTSLLSFEVDWDFQTQPHVCHEIY